MRRSRLGEPSWSQAHGLAGNTGTTRAGVDQWKAGVDYPDDIICVGPKYQYVYADDRQHLHQQGYRRLGEKYVLNLHFDDEETFDQIVNELAKLRYRSGGQYCFCHYF